MKRARGGNIKLRSTTRGEPSSKNRYAKKGSIPNQRVVYKGKNRVKKESNMN